MSRMFKSIDSTWNVFVGCLFDCTYCNAKKAALTRLRNLDRYKDGFNPHLVESELKRTFKPGEFIFVAYMGDIAFCKITDFALIFERIRKFHKTDFLLMSKNPRAFNGWSIKYPPNVYLGTTIETNRDYGKSKAPSPFQRFTDLRGYPHDKKFLSIEPIMDFDPKGLLPWVEALKPDIIEVGADNYHNNLPEPNSFKLDWLLEALRDICPKVIEKDGLERLKERR